jgi:uncharacterized membrane protein (DUF2068 family)
LSEEALDRAVGVRLVVVYKAVKAGLEFALAALLLAGIVFGFAPRLQLLAVQLRTHFTRAWAIGLSHLIMSSATPKHLHVGCIALFLDGVLTSVEAWALHRGHWWGPWLVVVASGSLLPWEIVELVRYQRVGRLLVFLVNAAIVVYLTMHALRARRRATE